MLAIRKPSYPDEDEEILEFVEKWNGSYATVYLPVLDQRVNLIKGLISKGVCIYAYTSNSEKQIMQY
jgi:hypothetical protein